jgi:multidrug efflux pump subunit AcrB
MPVGIFPQVGEPAIYVAQPYSGMDPVQMEGYLTYYYEYRVVYITGIDHVESKSIQRRPPPLRHPPRRLRPSQKTIVATLDPTKLSQYRISPEEAIAAVSKSSIVMLSGNMWTGKIERIARTNAAGAIQVGAGIITSYAHVNGKRTVYIPVTKRAMPEEVDVSLEFDQSLFVTNSLRGLVYEGLLGAAVSLWITGQTINVMTLGGLALPVGVFVAGTTVEIENIPAQMLPGVSHARAALEACSRTATARFLSRLSILAVFVPSLFMVGVAR